MCENTIEKLNTAQANDSLIQIIGIDFDRCLKQ